MVLCRLGSLSAHLSAMLKLCCQAPAFSQALRTELQPRIWQNLAESGSEPKSKLIQCMRGNVGAKGNEGVGYSILWGMQLIYTCSQIISNMEVSLSTSSKFGEYKASQKKLKLERRGADNVRLQTARAHCQ